MQPHSSAHPPFVLRRGLLLLLLVLAAAAATAAATVASTAVGANEAAQQSKHDAASIFSILHYLDTASLDWWADPHAHETAAATAATTAEDPSSISSSSSVAYKVAACAKSLQNAHARHQQLPSAAFAAKAALLGAGAAADATHVAGTNGPAFLVVTTGGGRGAEERERAATTLPRVVEATLRIHGAGAKDTTKEEEGRAQQHHHHHHQGLRGGLQAGGMLLQQQGGKGDELALYAPTPECAAASQSVSHLYAHGRVPHYVISVSAQQQAGRDEDGAAVVRAGEGDDDDKQEGEGAGEGNTGRLCAEAREAVEDGGALAAATTAKAARVCVDREAREGMLAGTITNVGAAPLCGASLPVLSPHSHREAKRLSRAVPVFAREAPPMAGGEGRAFEVQVDRGAFWLGVGEAVQAIYGLLVDPDYESCSSPTTTTTTTTTARRLVDATNAAAATAAAGVGGATNADIRAAKREARKRRKEAKLASKGLDHKLKKLKKVKKVGGLLIKKGTRKWRQEEKKKARLQAWHEKKGLRSTQKQGHAHTHGLHGPHQQQGAVVGAHGGGLAAVGRAGLASLQQRQKQQLGEEEEEAEAEEGGVEGVLVGTIQGALGGGGGGDKGFRGVGRVPGMRGARRFGFKKAIRYARKGIRRVHADKKGQGKGKKKGATTTALVHLV